MRGFNATPFNLLLEASHKGFSHVGLSTLDLHRTREFYEKVLGFKVVVADRTSANCIFDGPLELSVA